MKLTVTVEGKSYEVEVEVAEPGPVGPVGGPVRPAAAPVASRAPKPAASTSSAPVSNVSDDKACKSPLAGIVSAVEVSVGQEVEPDQALIVLEAMKMLTTVTSPQKGKIKNIPVAVGDGVKQGQLLVEFE